MKNDRVLELISSNLIATYNEHRQRMNDNHVSQEPSLVVRDSLSLYQNKIDLAYNEGIQVIDFGSPDDAKLNGNERDRFSVNLKVFPTDFSCILANQAISRILDILGIDYLDCVIVALPISGVPYIGLGTSKSDTESVNGVNDDDVSIERRAYYINQLTRLWGCFEIFVDSGQIKKLGVCDVETEAFKKLYEAARVKPDSIQVNAMNCCHVPTELNLFAKANGIRLLTHHDSVDILNTSDPSFNLTKFTLFLAWMARITINYNDRSVLYDKRYITSLRLI